MKITQIHTNKPQSLSFEIFPPKKEEDFKNIDEMLEILCDCHPEYISVTFGAGGSSNNNKTYLCVLFEITGHSISVSSG